MLGLRPFFCFYGGKWRAAPHYPLPQHSTIIEPFAGAAGYSTRYASHRVILVERDPQIAATWRYLLRVSQGEILSLPDLEENQSVADLRVCEEARFLIGWWLNKGGASPCKTPSAWMRLGTHANSYWGIEIRKRIAAQVESIRHWTLIEGDYTKAPNIEATWFIDPPYIHAGRHYRYGASRLDYYGLGFWCASRLGQALVCENEGATWLPFVPWRTIKSNPSKHGGKKSREVIWMGLC